MKRFILMFAILALITSCKSSASVAPIILKDSVSVTYKQGQTPLTPLIGEESEEMMFLSAPPHGNTSEVLPQQRVRSGQAHVEYTFPKTHSAQRTNKPAVPPTTIRVDTVFIERWHTQTVPTPPPRGESVGASKFYKDCTKGFWVLLIVLLGRFGFRIMKAIYLRK